MSELKCPICNKPMKQATYDYDKKDDDDTLYMSIMPCDCICNFAASKAVWQELIRTKELLEIESSEHELCHDAMVKRTEEVNRIRKALDVAVDVLKEINELLSSNKFDIKEVPLLNITQTKISMLLKCINIEQKDKR